VHFLRVGTVSLFADVTALIEDLEDVRREVTPARRREVDAVARANAQRSSIVCGERRGVVAVRVAEERERIDVGDALVEPDDVAHDLTDSARPFVLSVIPQRR
jgi:hypothetical protein